MKSANPAWVANTLHFSPEEVAKQERLQQKWEAKGNRINRVLIPLDGCEVYLGKHHIFDIVDAHGKGRRGRLEFVWISNPKERGSDIYLTKLPDDRKIRLVVKRRWGRIAKERLKEGVSLEPKKIDSVEERFVSATVKDRVSTEE